MQDKVNVLYISYNGLLEPILPSQAVPYLAGLALRGYRITLLTFEKRDKIRRLGRDGVGRMEERLKSEGIEWRHLIYHKWPRLTATLYDLFIGSVFCLYLILSRRIRIVHVRGVTPGSMMLLVARIVDVKILFDMRGLLAEEIAAGGGWKKDDAAFRLVKLAEKNLLRRADAVSVLTRKHLELNRGLDILKDRNIPMDVVPCCVDLKRFSYDAARAAAFKKELSLDRAFVLMYQGKIGTFYFMDEMVDFFKVVSCVHPDSVLLMVTNDPVDGVMRRAASNGIGSDRIRSVRGVWFDDMPRYLEAADAGIFFINPLNKLGSSPIKMGEFLASGVPVIINPGIGDTEELVRDNRVGVVVKDFTKRSYESAFGELLRLKGEGDALRARCRETAGRYLSLEDGIDRYALLYGKLSGGVK